jgi:hypothetical protein
MTAFIIAATEPAKHAGMGAFTWDDLSTLIAGIGAALVAAVVAVLGYRAQQGHARDERRAAMYAEALRAVEDYLEGPYRIRRRDGSAEQRAQITTWLSDVKSRINYYEALMDLHAPGDVAAFYTDFVKAAQSEAGTQMTDAWNMPPTTEDAQVPLGQAYDRSGSSRARRLVVDAMRSELQG